jgi:hypothetical protein
MVVVSDYVVLRMQMRGNMPTVNKRGIRDIWIDSEVTSVNEETGVEKRYNDDANVMFIAEGNVIKTVLSTEYLDVVSNDSLCEWCSKPIHRDETCRKCCDWKKTQSQNNE